MVGATMTRMNARADDLQLNRHLLYDRFGVSQVAMSPDGSTVRLAGPVETGVRVGGFATVDLEADLRLVVQVQSVELVEREGPELDFEMQAEAREIGVLRARARPMMRALHGHGIALGVLDGTGFTPVRAVEPFGERAFRPVSPAELATVVAALRGGSTTFEVGEHTEGHANSAAVPAHLHPAGFARHTFMCGQSGSGKTYTTGAVLERLLASTTLPILVIDPNSDHVGIGDVADPDDRSPAAERHRAVADGVQVVRARDCTGTATLCIDFSDLDLDFQALLLRMHPLTDLDEFHALRRVTAALTAPYSVHDVAAEAARRPETARLAVRIANLRIADWTLWRRGDERSALDRDLHRARCVVVDVGSLPTPDERTTVALALLGRRWAVRRRRDPVLLVIDEAHNVLPAHTDDALLAATADLGVLIAGEGRKFGLHLFVATQRPGKVHPNVVSQCDNLVLMRMNGSADIDALAGFFSHVPAPLLDRATGFGLGQALFAGPISPVPLLAKVGRRVSPQGGADVPTTWALAGVDERAGQDAT